MWNEMESELTDIDIKRVGEQVAKMQIPILLFIGDTV